MTDLTDLRFLARMAIDTLRDPKEGAAEVLRLAPPRSVLWMAFALMIVLSLIAGEVIVMLMGELDAGPLAGRSSLALGLMQAAALFFMVYAITYIGQAFGGTGSFDGALALITWLEVILLMLQALQLILFVIAPPFAALLSLVAIGLFGWLLVNFIAVLHGFNSVGMVFVMTLVSFIGILFAFGIVLAILGIDIGTGGLPNEL